MSCESLRRFAKGLCEAVMAGLGDMVFGVYLLGTLLISTAVCMPRVAYVVLEDVLRGWIGIAAVMDAGNA
ncbi:hypothetical protein PI125_g6077 [Phytophthora idaei]|nr:hypothetical protein PI125_g6077 [Phytophthora idaei]